MGWKKVVVVLAIVFAGAAYWLYSPLPPGYSSDTRRQLQMAMASIKVLFLVSHVGACLGFGTEAAIARNLALKLMKYRTLPPELFEGIVTSDTQFDGVPVRVYEPSDSLKETLPGIIHYHGGGYVYGSIDTVDSVARRLCKDTRTVVVSVDYRLAPEFPFPAAIDDCATATRYFLSHATDFHVDPKRIAVSGDSAGGNLAAAVSLKLRDEKFPIPVKLQILIYPTVQGLDFYLPSMVQNEDGPLLTRSNMAFFTAMYIDGHGDRIRAIEENRHVSKRFREVAAKTILNLDKLPKEFLKGYERPAFPDGDEKIWNEMKTTLLNPYYSPLAAESLENLPEAYVFTANFDPLRDEGWLYAERLREAKNTVTIYNAENGFHGIVNFVSVYPEADVVFEEIVKFIRARL